MPKSIYRQPGARHYQLLHRSIRDPEVGESDRVLGEIQTKGKARDFSDSADLFEDASEYDYGQHLRQMGADREAIFVEAGTQQQRKQQHRSYADFMGIPAAGSSFGGLEPDMDPQLREALEALEDDAFNVEGEAEGGDFFGELLESGEHEEGDEDWEDDLEETEEQQTAWDREMSRYKSRQPKTSNSDSEEEDGDTVGELRTLPKSRKQQKAADSVSGSNFSMSSSAMFRNNGLQTLDDQFDALELEYADSDSEEEDFDGDEIPNLVEDRADMNGILDDFLENYEIRGKKLEPSVVAMLQSTRRTDDNDQEINSDPLSQLESLRRQLRDIDPNATADENKRRILYRARQIELADSKRSKHTATDEIVWQTAEEKRKDRWDCETVLSNYSNLENHPKMLRLRTIAKAKQETKIVVNSDGFPETLKTVEETSNSAESLGDDNGQSSDGTAVPGVIKRPSQETSEEKKARKAAVKEQQAARRTQKKATRNEFGQERKRQNNVEARKNKADITPLHPRAGVKAVALS